MTPRRYGPLQYVPINRRPKLTWPGGARVALWVNPNIEFFGRGSSAGHFPAVYQFVIWNQHSATFERPENEGTDGFVALQSTPADCLLQFGRHFDL